MLFALSLSVTANPNVKNKALFSEDTKEAVSAFDEMMSGGQIEWDDLITLMHNHAKRYAYLMSQFEQHREKIDINSDPYHRYTTYIHKRTEESEDFARRSAVSWRVGWDLTRRDMLSKLTWKGFPGTRRTAIEFLKMENNEETFGYDWKPEPIVDDPTVQKWIDWIEKHPDKKKP
jgi:hypothetical protein